MIPLYYARDLKLGFSPEWVALCKRSMASILPVFNSERVLRDYWRCSTRLRHGKVDDLTGDFAIGASSPRGRRSSVPRGPESSQRGAAPTQVQFRDTVRPRSSGLNGLAPSDARRVRCAARARI